jgi:hypothetical protein
VNPAEVPDTIVSDFARNFWGMSLDQLEPGSQDVARQALGSVLPRLESLVRAHIAAEAKDTMTPATVPVGLVDMGVTVFDDQAHENCSEDEGCPGNTRPYYEALMRESLAEILPEYGKRVREQVIEKIETAYGPLDIHCEDGLFDEGVLAVIATVRGES